jgi:hypothetical protein
VNGGQASNKRDIVSSQYLLFNFTSPQVSSFSYLHLFTKVTVQGENAGRWGKLLQDDHMTLAYFPGRQISRDEAKKDSGQYKDEGGQ